MGAAAFFGGFAAWLLLMFYSAILSGYALSVLWAWFIVATFSAPQISVPAAVGLALVVSYLTHQISDRKSERTFTEQLVHGFSWATFKPLFALAVGWVVKGFM